MNANISLQLLREIVKLLLVLVVFARPGTHGEAIHPFFKHYQYSTAPYHGYHNYFVRHVPVVPHTNPLIHHSSTFHHQTLIFPGAFDGQSSEERVSQASIQAPHSPFYIILGSTGQTSGNIQKNKFDSTRGTGIVNRAPTTQDTCSHLNLKGQCYSLAECTGKKGRPTSYCTNFSKFCCIINLACGDSTDDSSVYFRNQNYPFADRAQSKCGIKITKRNLDVCTLRIHAHYLNLPVGHGSCDGVHLGITGTRKQYKPLCGDLVGATFDVDISSTDSLKLFINNDHGSSLVWNLHVSQVSCSSPAKDLWPLETGGGGGIVTPIEPVITASPPVVVNPFQCGKSYRGGTQKANHGFSQIRDRGQIPFQYLSSFMAQAESQEDTRTEEFRDSSATVGANPLLTSLEWAVPNVSDSQLYQLAGPPKQLGGRITYGMKTRPHEFRWNVAMFRNGRYHCGASLISDRYVLTAAHCIVRYTSFPSSIQLSIGDWDINSISDGPSIRVKAAKIIAHPNYSSRTLENDIAVITLAESVKFTETILPICLPPNDLSLDGKIVTVTGWGRNENNRLQTSLMKHSAAAMTTAECNRRWASRGRINIVDSMLCMDAQDGDSCKGDSGGPSIMEYPRNSGKYVQVGIVSFGSASCTDKNLPGVYTKVTNYVKWIESQMV